MSDRQAVAIFQPSHSLMRYNYKIIKLRMSERPFQSIHIDSWK